MASHQPTPLVKSGDFVKSEGRTCYVEAVENKLGFNTYILVDIESGVLLRKARHQIEPTQLDFVTEFSDDFEGEIQQSQETVIKSEEKRFKKLSKEDLDTIADNRLSKNTKKQTLWGVAIFKDFLLETGEDPNFENYDVDHLASCLRNFYGGLRTKQGKFDSRSAYVNIRSCVNRHLTSPPFNRQINIMRDRQFMSANQVLTGILRDMKAKGLDTTSHKTAIPSGDFRKMYDCGVLSNDTPKHLQYKVFIEVSLHFGRRGREGLRQLGKNSIIFKTDDHNREYAMLNFNELDKNHQVQMPKEFEKKQIMYAQTEDPNCPVKSLKKYLSKLNSECTSFFQRPKPGTVSEEDETWYENKSLGIHKIESFMKNISGEAQLSAIYTNHCLRATTSTILSDAGVDSRKICSVTGHKNESSLASYVKEPSLNQRAQMCNILHHYGKQAAPGSTITQSEDNRMLVPTSCSLNSTMVTQMPQQQSMSNVTMDTSSAVFAGANFHGDTTINVSIRSK